MKGYLKRDNKDGKYYINHTSNKDGCRCYQGNDTSARGVCRSIGVTPMVVDCDGTEEKCVRVIDEDEKKAETNKVDVIEENAVDEKIMETKKNVK